MAATIRYNSLKECLNDMLAMASIQLALRLSPQIGGQWTFDSTTIYPTCKLCRVNSSLCEEKMSLE